MQNTFRSFIPRLVSTIPLRTIPTCLPIHTNITPGTFKQTIRCIFLTREIRSEGVSPDHGLEKIEGLLFCYGLCFECCVVGLTSSWKWDVRCHVWGLMERQNLARSPRPVQNRIPNFEGAETAAFALSKLRIFKRSKNIVITPDPSLKPIRELALTQNKDLYVPTPEFKDGFFWLFKDGSKEPEKVSEMVSFNGMSQWGLPVSLKDDIKVDMIVIGSVAVDGETGAHIGTGNGFSDSVHAILRTLGSATQRTKVVTVVHDAQVLQITQSTHLELHDVPVQVIVTPTRVIYTSSKKSKTEKDIELSTEQSPSFVPFV